MKRAEFLEIYKRRRRFALKEAYADDPHGPACMAASLVDLDKDAEKAWRKWQPTLLDTEAGEFDAALDASHKAMTSNVNVEMLRGMMKNNPHFRQLVKEETTRRIRTFKSWDGQVVHFLVELDDEQLGNLALKANRNKGKAARLGPVTITVLTEEQAKFLQPPATPATGGKQ